MPRANVESARSDIVPFNVFENVQVEISIRNEDDFFSYEGVVGTFELSERSLADNGIHMVHPAYLSPLSKVTVQDKERPPISVPKKATHFAFMYPVVELEAALKEREHSGLPDQLVHLLLVGGFIYFEGRRVLQINALSFAPARQRIYFREGASIDPNFVFPQAALDELMNNNRMQRVTLDALQVHGFEEFGWIHPEETFGGGRDVVSLRMARRMWEHGGFVYKCSDTPDCRLLSIDATADKDDLDKHQMSEFEQITRAAVNGASELKRALDELEADWERNPMMIGGQTPRRQAIDRRVSIRVPCLNVVHPPPYMYASTVH